MAAYSHNSCFYSYARGSRLRNETYKPENICYTSKELNLGDLRSSHFLPLTVKIDTGGRCAPGSHKKYDYDRKTPGKEPDPVTPKEKEKK